MNCANISLVQTSELLPSSQIVCVIQESYFKLIEGWLPSKVNELIWDYFLMPWERGKTDMPNHSLLHAACADLFFQYLEDKASFVLMIRSIKTYGNLMIFSPVLTKKDWTNWLLITSSTPFLPLLLMYLCNLNSVQEFASNCEWGIFSGTF